MVQGAARHTKLMITLFSHRIRFTEKNLEGRETAGCTHSLNYHYLTEGHTQSRNRHMTGSAPRQPPSPQPHRSTGSTKLTSQEHPGQGCGLEEKGTSRAQFGEVVQQPMTARDLFSLRAISLLLSQKEKKRTTRPSGHQGLFLLLTQNSTRSGICLFHQPYFLSLIFYASATQAFF